MKDPDPRIIWRWDRDLYEQQQSVVQNLLIWQGSTVLRASHIDEVTQVSRILAKSYPAIPTPPQTTMFGVAAESTTPQASSRLRFMWV
jgi:hypothetical protein